MKKIYSIVLIVLATLTQSVRAQDGEVTWGPQQKMEGTFGGFAGHDDSGYYIWHTEEEKVDDAVVTKYFADRYNRNHELESSKEVKLKDDKKRKRKFERMVFMGGKLVLFSSFLDRKENKNFIYAQYMNEETGEGEGTPVQLAATEPEKKGMPPTYNIAVTKDRTKLVLYSEEPVTPTVNQLVNFKVFDTELKMLWERQLELPYAGKNVDISNLNIETSGTLSAMLSVYAGKREKEPKKLPAYTYYILQYTQASDRLDAYKVEVPGKYVISVSFIDDISRGVITCAGFYSNKANGEVMGAFFQRIDKNSYEVVEKGTKDLGKDYLASFINEKKGSKAKEPYRLSMDQFILKDDGSAYLVAEQYKTDKTCVAGKDCEGFYYCRDIVCAGINADGSFAWVTRVSKDQQTENDDGLYSSYIFGMSGTRLYFIFNDNPKNLKAKPAPTPAPKGNKPVPAATPEPMTAGKSAVAVICSLDGGSGEMEPAKPLLNPKTDKGIVLKTKIYRQVGEKEYIVFGDLGKAFKLGTLTVN